MKRILLSAGALALLGLAACDDNGTGTPPGGVPDRLSLNVGVDSACGAIVRRTMVLKAQSEHLAVYEDPNNPSGGFTAAEYQDIADRFDDVIHPTDVENFGEPTDIDDSGKAIVLYTRAVNELTPRGASYIVGGFFWSRDLFPQQNEDGIQGCRGSNEAEMFYVLAPDPSGTINGHTRTKAYVRDNTLATLAHEYQHLINASRRLRIHDADWEDIWLDEGLSHVAEELTFFHTTGLAPLQNLTGPAVRTPASRLDLFAEFQDQNYGRLDTYLSDVEFQSPITDDDDLETRGAAWHLLRYAADRKGGNQRDTWFNLVNNTEFGVANFQEMFGDPLTIMNDWAVANYADDVVPGAAAIYQHPSWNHRNIFNDLYSTAYPLERRVLANGSTSFTIANASAAYLRFAVAPGGRAEIRTSTGNDGVAGSCLVGGPGVTLAVGGVFTGTPANASVMCFEGGATGAEFVYVPFFASTTTGFLTLTVQATGVGAVIGPPTPMRMGDGGLRATRGRADDGGFHMRLRQSERDLARRLRGGPRASVSQPAQAPATLRINVMRTK